MNVLSFLSAIVFSITLAEGIYILFNDIKNGLNRLYFCICLAISIWLLGASFGYSAHSRDEVVFWFKLCSAGFIFMHAFILHFVVKYTGFTRSKAVFLCYLPSFYFLYVSITDHLVFSDFIKGSYFWTALPDYNSFAFYVFMASYLSYYLISLVMLFLFMRKVKRVRLKKQSRVIFYSILITIASYNVEPFLVPVFFENKTYTIAPIFSVIWISFILYAMTRYKFLSISGDYFSSEVLESLNENVIILDMDKKILKCNQNIMNTLGLKKRDFMLNEIILEYDKFENYLSRINEKRKEIKTVFNFVASDKKKITMKTNMNLISDKYGDPIGYVIASSGIESIYQIIKSYKITERELDVIKLLLASMSSKEISLILKITERTVEAHLFNIFNKLGINSRLELTNFFKEYN
jgi:DNA-binding CsgD family transcriptional regulator